jgi:GntR family transcriptional regulator
MLDPGSSPLYQQVARLLERQIAQGVYRAGDRLPSEAALCAQFAVSRITVRAALDQLASGGLLRRVRGKGTFVAPAPVEHELIRLTDFVEDMTAAGLHATSRVTLMREEAASEAVAAHLGMPPGRAIVRLDRLRLADERPIAFDTTYLPARYGKLLDADRLTRETIYHLFESQYGITVTSGTFLIESAEASRDLARHLQIRSGAALLVVRRTSYTADGDTVYYQVRSYRADRVRFRLSLTRGPFGGRAQLTEFVPVFASPGAP